jgi:hypothetical protein
VRTDRMSARAWLAALLVISAALFFIGISIERSSTTHVEPGAVTPTGQPIASQHVEGGGTEAGEGSSAAPAASSERGSGETSPEGSAEWRPFGIDLESPVPVGGAILSSLLLAFAVLGLKTPVVPMLVIGFALVFLVFDLLEVAHQLDVAQPVLVVIALLLAAIHLVAALLAVRLLMAPRATLARP